MSRESEAPLSEDPLRVIASAPPTFRAEDARDVLKEQYGIDGVLESLVSERDQNYRVTQADGQQFVLKIANAAEQKTVTEIQVQALLHIENKRCAVATPRIVRTRDGSVSTTMVDNAVVHICRLVTYLPGRPAGDVPVDETLARNIGRSLAEIDIALADFEHVGESQALLWDLQRALEARPLLRQVRDDVLRESVSSCLADFAEDGLHRLQALPRQVIHGDLNTGNVLVAADDAASVAGVIDFGDMVRAPKVADLAIAASYMRSEADDPLALIAALVAGYDEVVRLVRDEVVLLYDLVRVRLAISIAILHWRVSARAAEDAYRQASIHSEADAALFFRLLGCGGRRLFTDRMMQATLDR